MKNTSIEARFMSKVNKTDSCWNWTGGTVQSNYYRYGSFKNGTKTVRAHRFSYSLYHGVIPEGMFVCHKCDNPLCVNPNHLFLGTAQDNATDMVNKNRQAKGAECGNARLSKKNILDIRAMWNTKDKNGKRKYKTAEIAEKFGVTSRNILYIVNNQRWTHV